MLSTVVVRSSSELIDGDVFARLSVVSCGLIHPTGRPYAHGMAFVTTAAASVIAILQVDDLFHGHDRGRDHGHGHVGQGVGKSEDENERGDERGDAKNEGGHENVNEDVAACADDYYCHGHHDLDPARDPARGRTEKMS